VQREAERQKRKASRHATGSRQEARGEFDDLVSALRSGEVFDKEGGKFQKRNRIRRPPSHLEADRERVITKITTNI